MYVTGKDKILKYVTSVMIRGHKTHDSPVDSDYLLRALMNDLVPFGTVISIVGDGTAQGDEVVTGNKIYELDGSSADCLIDLADEIIAGESAGDCLIFKCIDKTNTVSVTDENSAVHTFVDANDIVVYYWDTVTSKWLLAFQSYSASSTFATSSLYYQEIGLLEPNPVIKVVEGDTKETNKDDVYTEKLEFEADDLQVLKANWEFYRALANAGDIDICLYPRKHLSETMFVHEMPFSKVTGDFGGKMFRTIHLKSSKDCENADDYLTQYEDES